MAHVAKYTVAATGHLCNHYGRSEDMEKSAYVIRGNENIDPSRTHLNYDLAPHREGSQLDRLHQRLSEVKVQKRADVNVLCDWVVTVPKDLPKEEHTRFFSETYRFLSARYGEQNVVSAFVHNDETTPHIHFAFVPVTEDKKKGGFKVSAKEVLTRHDLQTFHTDLDAHLERTMGHEVHVLNGATKDGNKTVAELRKEAVAAEVREAQKEAAEARQKADIARMKMQDDLSEYLRVKDRVGALQGELEALKQEKDALTAAEVASMNEGKTIFGGLKGVSYKEFQRLKRTAQKVDDVAAAYREAVSQRDAAREDLRQTKVDAAERIRAAENERPSAKLQFELVAMKREVGELRAENAKLKEDNSAWKYLYEKLLTYVKPLIPENVFRIFTGKAQEQEHDRNDRGHGGRDR